MDTIAWVCCKCCFLTTEEISKCPKCGQYLLQKSIPDYANDGSSGENSVTSGEEPPSYGEGFGNPTHQERLENESEEPYSFTTN